MTAAATSRASAVGTSSGYSVRKVSVQEGPGLTIRAPARTDGSKVSTFRLASLRAPSRSPPSSLGIPQQTCSGQLTSQPAFSRTLTAALPMAGSL